MAKGRLEAFSDGVIAIIITIMVLELKVPHGTEWETLRPLIPVLLSYVLSFVFVGIHWNNHHHMLHALRQVNGGILWANLHLLFWLSLIPFVTRWMGENHFAALPVALYGAVLLMVACAYFILARSLIAHHGKAAQRRQEGFVSGSKTAPDYEAQSLLEPPNSTRISDKVICSILDKAGSLTPRPLRPAAS